VGGAKKKKNLSQTRRFALKSSSMPLAVSGQIEDLAQRFCWGLDEALRSVVGVGGRNLLLVGIGGGGAWWWMQCGMDEPPPISS